MKMWIPIATCAVIGLVMVVYLMVAAGGRRGVSPPGSPAAKSGLAEDEVRHVLEAFHLPQNLDVAALAVLLQSDSTNATLTARIRTERNQRDRVEQHLISPSVATRQFREYRLRLPDHYSVSWWDVLPIAQNDRLYYGNVSEPGNGFLAAVLRSTSAGEDLYLVRGTMAANLDPQLLAVMQSGMKQNSGALGIPSNLRLYERKQGRFE